MERGPFDLLFFDGGSDNVSASAIAELVKTGGIMVIDDLTPEARWPESWRGKPDPKRELAFNSGYFKAHEVRLREDISALLLVRL